MNLRGAVRVPLPPSEIDRVGAELSEMRGGLSRRDVGVALVVAGLGGDRGGPRGHTGAALRKGSETTLSSRARNAAQ